MVIGFLFLKVSYGMKQSTTGKNNSVRIYWHKIFSTFQDFPFLKPAAMFVEFSHSPDPDTMENKFF